MSFHALNCSPHISRHLNNDVCHFQKFKKVYLVIDFIMNRSTSCPDKKNTHIFNDYSQLHIFCMNLEECICYSYYTTIAMLYMQAISPQYQSHCKTFKIHSYSSLQAINKCFNIQQINPWSFNPGKDCFAFSPII